MPLREDLTDPPHVKRHRSHLPRLEEHFLLVPFAVSRPADIVDQQHRPAIGVNICHAHNEVGIGAITCHKQLGRHLTRPFHGLLQHLCRERPHLGLRLELAGIDPARKRTRRNLGRMKRIGLERCRRRIRHRSVRPQSPFRLQIQRSQLRRHRPVGGRPPFVPQRPRLSQRPHHVVTHLRLQNLGPRPPLQMVVKPGQHVPRHRELGILGKRHLVRDVRLLEPAMQPRANHQALVRSRQDIAPPLAADVAVDRAHIHEVEPTANRNAGNVHLVEMERAVLGLPVVVIRGMLQPLFQQGAVVRPDATDGIHPLEPLGTRRPANAVPLVIQAEAGIDHVLGREVGRTRHREKILREPRL